MMKERNIEQNILSGSKTKHETFYLTKHENISDMLSHYLLKRFNRII